MDFLFRQINAAETPLLKDLLKLFGNVFGEPETYIESMPTDEYLKSLLEKEHFIALVALEKETVIGGLVAYVLDKFEQDRREIYIYDLAVLADYRRQKVATNLIKHLIKVAREKKAYVIFVQADRGDMPAIKLYESIGIREDVLHFDIQVNQGKSGKS